MWGKGSEDGNQDWLNGRLGMSMLIPSNLRLCWKLEEEVSARRQVKAKKAAIKPGSAFVTFPNKACAVSRQGFAQVPAVAPWKANPWSQLWLDELVQSRNSPRLLHTNFTFLRSASRVPLKWQKTPQDDILHRWMGGTLETAPRFSIIAHLIELSCAPVIRPITHPRNTCYVAVPAASESQYQHV